MMGDYERVIAAYLYLCALEKQGLVIDGLNIHTAWIDYCRSHNRDSVESFLTGAAVTNGFQL